jgi:YVTN family beta-propeller protein
MKKFLILLLFGFGLNSCTKAPTGSSSYFTPQAVAVYVLNQGNYGQGNASLSAYFPDSNFAESDLFKLANGMNLGDVGNDIQLYNGNAYMVINNSDKVVVMDASTALYVGTVYFPSGTSPYRIAFYNSSNVAFVSDLYTNSVSVINLASNTVMAQDSIPVGPEPYGIACAFGEVCVANSGYGSGNTVSLINATTRKVVKTVSVGKGPTEVEPDRSGNFWVVCAGEPGDNGSIYVVSASSNSVTDSIIIGKTIPSFTGHTLAMDGQDGVAYLIADSSVVKLSMSNRTIMNSDLMNGNFYSIAADGATGDVYVTKANSGTADGKVYIYTSSGEYTNRSFTAGIYPDGIVFIR